MRNLNPTGYIEGKEDHRTHQGRGAETCDHREREAWPSVRLGSAYIALVDLPSSVRAGDWTHARAITKRIEGAIEQGGWTAAEAARLHKMQEAWAVRAAGADPVFNIKGWQRKGSGHNLSPALKLLREISSTLRERKE